MTLSLKKCLSAIPLFLIATSSYGNEDSYLFFSKAMRESHLESYSTEEKKLIEKDLNVVRSVCFGDNLQAITGRNTVYLATAGGPGCRKSTILERFLQKQEFLAPYVDPDQRALKFMVHTYYDKSLTALEIAKEENYALVKKSAYDKWQAASNYIAVTLLEEAFKKHSHVVHGATSTGGHIASFYKRLKEENYDIILLLCSCEDATAQEAIKYRNEVQKFYQSTPEDVISKGKLFPQRLSTYFTYADILYFYWSDSVFAPERLAAVLAQGNLIVKDQAALDAFIHKYEKDRASLKEEGKDLPSWDELLSLALE